MHLYFGRSQVTMLSYIVLVIVINNIFIGSCTQLDNVTNSLHQNLSDFTYTWINETRTRSLFPSIIDSKEVDCLGLGKTVAIALAWFFADKPNALDVQFLLSSRKQPNRVQVYTGKQFGLEWTDFQTKRRTIIIVHGFLSHGGVQWIIDMEKAFLEWDDVNVVVVDWSAGGNTWNYFKAAINTRTVGYQISRFLEHIVNATTVISDWGPVHLIGHSLGAHICGFAAKEFRKRNNWTINRITALDPAQPCFQSTDPSIHLHKTDASFVDIIHTNGRLLYHLGLGLPEPIGHVDFYPNGGRTQPGCVKSDTTYFGFLPIPQTSIQQAICSHGRSYIYLTESLRIATANNCSFWSHYWNLSYRNVKQIMSEGCSDNMCTEMGIKAEDYTHRGTFFLVTSNNPPYCVNISKIPVEVKEQLESDLSNELND